MILENIHLKDFRIHQDTKLSFGSGMNLITGPNGIGKTNILEAIHFLSLTKSFLTSSDGNLLRHGAAFFSIIGNFSSRHRKTLQVKAISPRGDVKRLFVNGSEVERKATHIGEIPTVVLSPQDYTLTAGGPRERRRFMNNIISQSSSTYLADLLRYRRVLRQRNELLMRLKRSAQAGGEDLLESWTKELVTIGARIIEARLKFCDVFSELLCDAHEQLGGVLERPTLSYSPIEGYNISPNEGVYRDITREAIASAFRSVLDKRTKGERERGVTLVGPHRDELVFKIDDLEVRRFASQGQHRTFGMALKLSQYRYLLYMTEEEPIMLLDDVFDNLDRDRITLFLGILQNEGMGQTIVTAARKEILEGFVDFTGGNNRMIELTGAGENQPSPIPVHAT